MKTLMNIQSQITRKTTARERIDMAAMIRVGRLANAIAFAEHAMYEGKKQTDIGVRRRQVYQANYLLGGYLYEAVQMIQELVSKYGKQPYFTEFVVFNAVTRKYREVLTEFAFSPGYHQENADYATKNGLERQELDLCSLSAGCWLSKEGEFNLQAIYAFDTNNLVANLERSMDTEDVFKFVAVEIPVITKRFLAGATQFIDGMTRKMMFSRVLKASDKG